MGDTLTPLVMSVGVLMLMLIGTYLRHYGLLHVTEFWRWSRKLYFEIIIVARLRRMNPSETIMLKEFIVEQKAFNKTILDEVHTINRGLYGDAKNGVKGLIIRQDEDDRRIEALEKEVGKLKGFRNKVIWTGAGFVAGLQGLWEFIKWKSK